VRGELCRPRRAMEVVSGSSPRARGAGLHGGVRPVLAGILPACAGSCRGVGRYRPGSGDHPRVRGERLERSSFAATACGSSPRAREAGRSRRADGHGLRIIPAARGADHRGRVAPARHGIIPACAGSCRGRQRPRSDHQDHPRVRGELLEARELAGLFLGSSPRARGAGGVALRG